MGGQVSKRYVGLLIGRLRLLIGRSSYSQESQASQKVGQTTHKEDMLNKGELNYSQPDKATHW